MCLSAKLHSCTLQKFVQYNQFHKILTSVSEYFPLLAEDPVHEKRTVHRTPSHVNCARSIHVRRPVFGKIIKRPSSLLHKNRPVVARLWLLYRL